MSGTHVLNIPDKGKAASLYFVGQDRLRLIEGAEQEEHLPLQEQFIQRDRKRRIKKHRG